MSGVRNFNKCILMLKFLKIFCLDFVENDICFL